MLKPAKFENLRNYPNIPIYEIYFVDYLIYIFKIVDSGKNINSQADNYKKIIIYNSNKHAKTCSFEQQNAHSQAHFEGVWIPD